MLKEPYISYLKHGFEVIFPTKEYERFAKLSVLSMKQLQNLIAMGVSYFLHYRTSRWL